MDIEYQKMLEVMGGKPEGNIAGNDIVLSRCGIGKVNAALGAKNMIDKHKPQCIISTGLAGGIDPHIRVMDVLAATQAVYHDVDCGVGLGCVLGQVQGLPARYDADKHLVDTALAVPLAQGERLMTGLICTGDQFITDRERQDAIKRNFPDGMACDMESAAIAHTCYLNNVPFMSLRVISDTPGNTDNHQQQWEEFLTSMCDESFRFVKHFLELLR